GGAPGEQIPPFGAGSFGDAVAGCRCSALPGSLPRRRKSALRGGGGRLTGRQDRREDPRRSCSVGFDFQASQSTGLRDGSRRFQLEGANRSSIGKISGRHTSMSKDSSSVDQGEKLEKLPMGPTISRPGPTLLMQVATAVNVVTRSICSRDTSRQDATKTI